MFYKIEKKSEECKVIIEVQIDSKDFNEAIKRNGDNTKQETVDAAINELISTTFNEIIRKEKIDVASYPKISLSENISEQFPFAYIAEVSIMPENFVKEYKGLNIKKEEINVSNEEINEYIKNELAKYKTLKNVDTTLQYGHTAVFDFCGKLDGVAFEGGTATNYELLIGSNSFVPGFESQMVGMKINETRNLNITFPKDYVEHLAGKDVVFEVTLHEIKEDVYPTLNDEFVQSLKIEKVNDLVSYNNYIHNIIYQSKEKAANNNLVAQIFKLLKEKNPTIIPSGIVNDLVESQIDQLSKTAEAYKIPLDMFLKYSGINSLEEYKVSYAEIAKNQVHEELILKEVIKLENIIISDEQANEYLNQNENLKERYSLQAIKEFLAMQKCVDELVKLNTVR